MRVRSPKNRGACASACGTIFEVRVCVRRTGKYIATQRLGSEHESVSRNSPEITNETHSKQQDQTESETEENSRQELTEDEMLSQGIAHF